MKEKIKRVYNFSAGPSQLPQAVIEKLKEEEFNYEGKGYWIAEISHRSSMFVELYENTISKVRSIMQVPEDYDVFFAHGGAVLQFAAIPLNFVKKGKTACYVDTGVWSKQAIDQVKSVPCKIVASSKDRNYNYIPQIPEHFGVMPAYLHITDNNTIYGTEYHELPDTNGVPLISDCTSNILSKQVDINKYQMIYSGAQKNLGISGICLLIVHKKLLEISKEKTDIAPMLNYFNHSQHASMYNTPNTFGLYVAGLILDWIIEEGGIQVMQKRNRIKAEMFYNYLDETDFYISHVEKPYRSLMNAPFFIKNEKLEDKFLSEAEAHDLFFLKGHRITGGLRASIYNSMPIDGVKILIEFMKDFEKRA